MGRILLTLVLAAAAPILLAAGTEGDAEYRQAIKNLTNSDQETRLQAVEFLAKQESLPVAAIDPLIEFIRAENQQSVSRQLRDAGEVPKLGDETSTVRLKADPNKFVGKHVVMVGTIGITDHWGAGYRRFSEIYYAFHFDDGVDSVYLYVPRFYGEFITSRVALAQERGGRLTVRLTARYAEELSPLPEFWDYLKIVDVQYLTGDQTWGPPLLAGIRFATQALAKVGRPGIPKFVGLLAGLPEGPQSLTKLAIGVSLSEMDQKSKLAARSAMDKRFRQTRDDVARQSLKYAAELMMDE